MVKAKFPVGCANELGLGVEQLRQAAGPCVGSARFDDGTPFGGSKGITKRNLQTEFHVSPLGTVRIRLQER
jgi:hypothetical protein